MFDTPDDHPFPLQRKPKPQRTRFMVELDGTVDDYTVALLSRMVDYYFAPRNPSVSQVSTERGYDHYDGYLDPS